METWKLYAFAAAVFAGITSVLAKAGLKTLGADAALCLRTAFVLVFVVLGTALLTGITKTLDALKATDGKTIGFLLASSLATALSWICYFRAMKDGSVAYVSLVDKGSILLTLLLSVTLLGEAFTWRIACGGGLVLAGLFVLATGK
jgi:transporter family protein